jgi:phosphatidylglycerophosphate synthase
MDSRLETLRNDFKDHWWWLPNLLTGARLLGGPVFGILAIFSLTGRVTWIVLLFIFVSLALTDFLDGLSARLFNCRSEYGRLLDPVADMFFGIFSLAFLVIKNTIASSLMDFSLSRYLVIWVSWGLLIQLVIYHIGLIKLLRHNIGLKVSTIGKIKTVLISLTIVAQILPMQYEIIRSVNLAIMALTSLSILASFLAYRNRH